MTTLQEITDSLPEWQKAQLDEVASLMLEIYHTLSRMRYLPPESIQPGPHDIAPLLPFYQSLHLHPSIIYLYSILPYIDPLAAPNFDFYGGGQFADFRDEKVVEEGRNPLFDDGKDPAKKLRPWMTLLSLRGAILSLFLVYDARNHVVGIFNLEAELNWSKDPGLTFIEREVGEDGDQDGDGACDDVGESDGGEVPVAIAAEEGAQGVSRREEEDGDENGEDGNEDDENEESGNDDEDEEEDDEYAEYQDENYWEDIWARSAPEVLRDIVTWYHELKEVPGSRQFAYNSWEEWGEDVVVPLLQKHGWPGQDFDGDAFLVDQIRTMAMRAVRESAEELVTRVEELRCRMEGLEKNQASRAATDAARLEMTKNYGVDEEWVVHFELWMEERRDRTLPERFDEAKKALERLYPDGKCPQDEDVPLLELKSVQMERFRIWQNVQKLRDEKPGERGGPTTVAGIQRELREEEKKLAVCERAVVACLADVARLCPGMLPLPVEVGEQAQQWNLEEQIRWATSQIQGAEENSADIRTWMAQLPVGAERARNLALDHLLREDSQLKYNVRARKWHSEESRRLKGDMS